MKPLLLPTVVSLTLYCSVALSVRASDWPQWRGPNRDGHSKENRLLREWPTGGPKLLWQVTNIGSGFSTPSISGGRIFLTGNEGMTNEFALALSAKDGRRLWSAPLGKVGHPEQDPKYPGARSTPTVDGDLVYALGSDGDLVCVEISNARERWRKNLRTDFAGKHGEWAYAESPLIDVDALICTPGGSNATMVALDKKTGAVIWKCAMPEADDAAYASAVIAELGGLKQYVQFLAKGLAGVDAKTGRLLWRYARSAKGSPAVVMTPLVSDGYVYSGAFRAGSALVKPMKKEDAFIVEEIYFNNKLPFGLGSVVKMGDHIYGTGNQSFMCVELKTGTIKWEERSAGLSLLAVDGLMFAHFANGDVGLLEPGPDSFGQKARFTPPKRPNAANENALELPALADGRLYIHEQNSLWCYDVRAAN
jgi:outer membrane protein assembly factor BamB